MGKKRILFVCTYNGARSRIAEEFVNLRAAGRIEAYSSCFENGKIGSLPRDVMREIGVDLSGEAPKSVFERYKDKEFYDYVISLCHEAATADCPVFKSSVDALYGKEAQRISWTVPAFNSIEGSEEEKKAEARQIRDKIASEVRSFLAGIGIDSENS